MPKFLVALTSSRTCEYRVEVTAPDDADAELRALALWDDVGETAFTKFVTINDEDNVDIAWSKEIE